MIPDKQIRVEKWAAPKNSKGDAKEQIVAAYNLFAEVVRTGGGRSDSNGQTKLNNSVQFKIRFRPDWMVTSAWKIVYLKQRYSITEIQRIDEKRFNWIINCESPTTTA